MTNKPSRHTHHSNTIINIDREEAVVEGMSEEEALRLKERRKEKKK